MIFDAHTHLNFEGFDEEERTQRAEEIAASVTPPSKTMFLPPPLLGEASKLSKISLGSPNRGADSVRSAEAEG